MALKAKVLAVLFAGMAGAVAQAHAAERDVRHATDPVGDQRFSASFLNRDGHPLSITFTVPRRTLRESSTEFGYSHEETRQIAGKCRCNQREFDRRVEAYYRSRLLSWDKAGNRRFLRVDVPAVVARNAPRLRDVANEFERVGYARGYGKDDTVDAVVTFVQTGLNYRVPPREEGGRDILGFYQPLRALETGSGDCDTKAALLASILANIPGTRMIGVHVANHYLVGIARRPGAGDATIAFRGQTYVLIEPAGPARLRPGRVAQATEVALREMKGVRIDPLF